jgi:hypothetical protein
MSPWERIAPGLAFICCVVLTTCALLAMSSRAHGAEEVPYATLRAIVYVESHGVLLRDGSVAGAVRQDGAAREVGVAQLAPVVCRQWGFDRAALRSDDRYCLACARLHLLWLRHHTRSWAEAVRAYNGGLAGRNRPSAFAYARRVAAASL